MLIILIVCSGFDDNNNNERSTASELFAESLGIMEVSFIDESSTDRELEDSDDSDLKELRQDLKFSQPSR